MVKRDATNQPARLEFPEWIEPMAATLTQERFTGPEWTFERKYDGIRLIAFKQGDVVRLYSRTRKEKALPGIAAAVAALPVADAILDGEVEWDGHTAYHVFDVIWIDGRDVTRLPLTERRRILAELPLAAPMRRVRELDGTAPCLLYGYGAYGMSMPASFSSTRLSLVDRGFVYAIAHVRGGSEKGWRWYREGKLAKKPNTFRDFIAASEYLIEHGWSARGKIIAHGGSAGGTLIGAIANMRPDLSAGLIAEVPFVNVLNTMLDETLPLTPPEWPEWGDPLRDAAAFRTIQG